jgi:hypothetical protein
MNEYEKFINEKTHLGGEYGFEPIFMPDMLFDFQKYLVTWQCLKGRGAIFSDCGTGKSFMQLTWVQNVVQKTNGRILILTPLAVGQQTVREGAKLGIEVYQSRDGSLPEGKKIIVTNYEKLHLFDKNDFVGCVCDESSILKHFTGATQMAVTRFMSKMPYRLLCTATAAPNDYIELGTSSEALGEISNSDMLARFFKQLDDKGQKKEAALLEQNQKMAKHFAKLSFRVHQSIGQWRLKKHAETEFWRWVCSWARAMRKPSDLGFSDDRFILPELIERNHIIEPSTPPDGWLLTLPAIGLKEEREERKRTLKERCSFVADLVNHDRPAVIWCHMNEEGKHLAKTIPNSMEVCGATPDEEKEEIYKAFSDGELLKLIIKPKIGAWGLNWQHCAHVVTFASHSYEQFYQSVRRCWRFGQKNPVKLDVIATTGEAGVIGNMLRKAELADKMFEDIVKQMNNAESLKRTNKNTNKMEVPSWL